MSNEIVTTGSNALVRPAMRFRCVCCTEEGAMAQGSYEDALILMEHLGWHVGANLLCPACVQKKSRQFKDKFFK